ncbi:hypothetical protein FB45DRAFT_949939, partial [Roridomyces roridus]
HPHRAPTYSTIFDENPYANHPRLCSIEKEDLKLLKQKTRNLTEQPDALQTRLRAVESKMGLIFTLQSVA